MRKVNQLGIDLIKSFEKCVLHPYDDGAGYMTIGWGHLIRRGEDFGSRITQEEADELLRNDLRQAEWAVERQVKVPLNDNQFAALVSFTFNVGAGGLARSSLLKFLNRGEYDQVPDRLKPWNKAKGKVLRGLVRRRAAEGRLWLRPVVTPVEQRVVAAVGEESAEGKGTPEPDTPPPSTPESGPTTDLQPSTQVQVKANKDSLVKKILGWAAGSFSLGTAFSGTTAAIASMTGLSENAQLLLIAVGIAAGVLFASVFGAMAIYVAWKDHAQTKDIMADPDKRNVK